MPNMAHRAPRCRRRPSARVARAQPGYAMVCFAGVFLALLVVRIPSHPVPSRPITSHHVLSPIHRRSPQLQRCPEPTCRQMGVRFCGPRAGGVRECTCVHLTRLCACRLQIRYKRLEDREATAKLYGLNKGEARNPGYGYGSPQSRIRTSAASDTDFRNAGYGSLQSRMRSCAPIFR